MKKTYQLLVINFLFSQILFSQNYSFGPSIRVNDDPPGTSFHITSQHSIGCRGDTVYLVWSDERINPRAVYFSRSTDAGSSWGANLRISSSVPGVHGITPNMVLDAQGRIFVCYCQNDENNGWNRDIYFTKSTDGGLSFTIPVLVNDTTRYVQDLPSIAVDSSGHFVYVAWEDSRNIVSPPNYDIYLARSMDGGLSFSASVRVDDTGTDSSDQETPTIGCTRTGDTVYTAWDDDRSNLNIYFSRSTNGGVLFEPSILVNDTTGTGQSSQGDPSLSLSDNGNIYIVWRDNRFGPRQIYFAKSTDMGVSFIDHKRITDTLISGGSSPSIGTLHDSLIFSVWSDARTYSQTGDDIYFSFSSNGGDSFSPNIRVNDTLVMRDAWQWYPTVCVNQTGKVFVGWSDDRYFGGGPGFDICFASGQYVGIEENLSQKNNQPLIFCCPNPCRNILTVDSRGFPVEEIKIYDIAGRCVKSVDMKGRHSIRIIMSGLPEGVYFAAIGTINNYKVKKIIIIR